MLTARQIARAYDLSVASFWRGDATDDPLLNWLGRFQSTERLLEPAERPEAVSLLGGGGAGIRWYTTPTEILGFTAGQPPVCYRVPVDTELPVARNSRNSEIFVRTDVETLSV
jgi:hypothetical protein